MSTTPPEKLADELERLGQTWRSALESQKARYAEEILEAMRFAVVHLLGKAIGRQPRLNAADRDDLDQEARLAILTGLPLWEPERGRLFTYLYARVRGHLTNRARSRNRGIQAETADETTLEEALTYEVDPSEQIHLRDRLIAFLDTLPTREREMLLLRLEGYSNREIGERCNLSDERVRTLINEIVAKGRKVLEAP